VSSKLTFLHYAAAACAVVFVVNFFAALYATLLIGLRTGAVVNRADERHLSWGERAGRANSRLGRFFVEDEFRSLRRLYFGAWLTMIASAGLGFLLLFLAGRSWGG
jgi:hypothetical protein